MNDKTIDIHVPVLARVEGEGALELKITDQRIDELRLRIYEPPRFFEKFLEGRDYYDVPDVVARICGICPVAYQMSAVHALESVFDISVSPWTHAMRRVMYCGEWLQSHSLHIHMLAAPDYLGFNSVIEMSAEYADEVRRGLKLQSLGNDLIALFGGRSVHPVGVCTGGFHRAPDEAVIESILARLREAVGDAEDLVTWTASLDLPDEEQDFVSVCLRQAEEYPLIGRRIVSDRGLDIDIAEYEDHFSERQVAHSTALHCLLEGRPYLLGPLARLNLNRDRLPPAVSAVMEATGIRFPSRNMFHSIVARAVEIHYAILEAIRLLEKTSAPENSRVEFSPKAGLGFGCSEAPRGLLWHRYELDPAGRVKTARIVPPTSQNQARIEEDLRRSLEHLGLDKEEDVLRLHAEKVIRNYDPCISCATHFLDLKIEHQNREVPSAREDSGLPENTELKVIGIGSPFGEDRLGWYVIEKLRREFAATDRPVSFLALDRPGPALIEHMKDARGIVLIDALSNTGQPGRIQRLSPADIEGQESNRLSSHAIGIADTLQLARALGIEARLMLIGMELPEQEQEAVDEKHIDRLVEEVKQALCDR